MATPRRAAAAGDSSPLLDLDAAPRRAAELAAQTPAAPVTLSRSRRRLTRLVLAPLAALSVAGLAASMFAAPATEPLTAVGQAAQPNDSLGTSRSHGRDPLHLTNSPLPSARATEATDPAAGQEPLDTSAAVEIDALPIPAPAPAEDVAPVEEATPAEDVAPVEEAAPAEDTAPAFDSTALGEVAGQRYATSGVNVRTGPGTGYDVRTTVAAGAELSITDVEADGWRQVSLNERAGWIKASFLTETKPAVATPSSSSSSVSGSASSSTSSGGFSTAVCANAAGVEAGLTERTKNVLRAVCAQFPKVSSYGGKRSGGGNHGAGKAIDVMVSGSYGWEIANWARANATALGIAEVIYEQQIWTTQRAGDGWRGMEDRGSVSANHYDHVHLSVH